MVNILYSQNVQATGISVIIAYYIATIARTEQVAVVSCTSTQDIVACASCNHVVAAGAGYGVSAATPVQRGNIQQLHRGKIENISSAAAGDGIEPRPTINTFDPILWHELSQPDPVVTIAS